MKNQEEINKIHTELTLEQKLIYEFYYSLECCLSHNNYLFNAKNMVLDTDNIINSHSHTYIPKP